MEIKLYEIDKELRVVWDSIVDAEEVDDSMLDRLKQLQMDREEKIKACGHVIKNLRAYINALKEEEISLEKRRHHIESRLEWLKAYVAGFLGEGNKRNYGTVILSWRKSESVHIPDEECVPPQYCRISYEPNKSQIKEDIKAGASLPFASLVEKQNLVVK